MFYLFIFFLNMHVHRKSQANGRKTKKQKTKRQKSSIFISLYVLPETFTPLKKQWKQPRRKLGPSVRLCASFQARVLHTQGLCRKMCRNQAGARNKGKGANHSGLSAGPGAWLNDLILLQVGSAGGGWPSQQHLESHTRACLFNCPLLGPIRADFTP